MPLKDLLSAIAVGAREEELFTSVANRLTRLEKQITDKEKRQFSEKAHGKTVSQVVKDLLNAFNPDTLEDLHTKIEQENPGAAPVEKEEKFNRLKTDLQNNAAKVFTGELNEYLENVRKAHEQKVDMQNPDTVTAVGWDRDSKTKAETIAHDFKSWMVQHKDEITALQIFYAQPYRRRELTYAMIKDVLERLKAEKPVLAPMQVWRAYEQLEKTNGSPRNELIALVSLIRKVSGMDKTLTAFDKIVDKNFQNWVFKKQAGALKFTEEQMQWLRMIKDHIATSIHLDADDLDYTPFDAAGGKGKMYQLFGDKMNEIINELNEALAA